MCEKTDGIRCLMYLTEINMHGQPVEAQFLIDRKNDYYFLPYESLHLPLQENLGGYHRGTLLDGELVRQKSGKLVYLIFDLLAIDNENVTGRPFLKRLGKTEEFIVKPFKGESDHYMSCRPSSTLTMTSEFARKYPDDVVHQPFQIEMKKMELPYGMEMMFKDKIPNLPHGNDGLIFTSRDDPYTHGTDQKILKWKPPHENTIDFRLQLGPFPGEDGENPDWDAMPPMGLLVNHGDRKDGYRWFADLTLRDEEWKALQALQQQIDGRIIECFRDPHIPERDVWRPKTDAGVPRFRDDKTAANHISTVESVLESIRDAVTEQDLIAEAHKIRTAYKKRQPPAKVREQAPIKASE